MLLRDEVFQPLRRSLREAGYPLVLQPSGCIIPVSPDQYLQTLNSDALLSRTLKRYNVIIAESKEYFMNEVLSRIESKQQPRDNKDENLHLRSLNAPPSSHPQ